MRIETDRKDRAKLKRLSRRQFIKLTGATAAGLLVGCLAQQEEKSTLALINGTLIDGTGARAQPDAVVLIQGGRILSAGVRTHVEIPAHAKIIDVQGGAMLPGIINAHVHAAYNEVMLKTWASDGVTTVRDLGAYTPNLDELFLRRNALCAIPACARLVAVGSFVNVAGGYPVAFWGGHVVAVSTPEDATQAVNRLVDAGAPNVDFDLGMPIREIALMQEAGMMPLQIIVAATRNGARACHMENELGTLEAGKLADVLVVDGNPLDDLQAFTRKRHVLREGKAVFPSSGVGPI